ncbi:unnamed protein product [Trichobilharzia regenti]|nr:unnamed protein product [Trichobilharzia regenti]
MEPVNQIPWQRVNEVLYSIRDVKEVDLWIDRINFVAALLSAPSLASAVSSEKNFHRPHLPVTYTKLNMVSSNCCWENVFTLICSVCVCVCELASFSLSPFDYEQNNKHQASVFKLLKFK